MRIAVIADVHGNVDALTAVLADVATRGADRLVCLGDHVSGPLAADSAVDLLMSMDLVAIAGNHDRYLLTQAVAQMGPSDRAARLQLRPDQMDWLAALPVTAWIGDEVFLCHGTPTSDDTYLLETVTPDGRLALSDRAEVEARLGDLRPPVVLCAHSHMARTVRLGTTLIVNPGSVGCPGYTDDAPPHVMQSGAPDAVYALVERSGGVWRATHVSVPYDPTAMADMAGRGGRPEWERALRTGWVR